MSDPNPKPAPSPVLLLASASPRRKELLEAQGISLLVRPGDADETLPPGLSLEDALCAVAERKARAVADAAPPDAFVLAADTVVATGTQVLGKPRDAEEAAAMLARLSGKTHRVLTAVALAHQGRMRSFATVTRVRFRTLSGDEIARYVASGEPLDKAGAYAIQGRGAAFVLDIDGSYTNVVGLPLAQTLELLASEGFYYGR